MQNLKDSSIRLAMQIFLLGFCVFSLTITNVLGACVTPPTGLVSWWKGEGNFLDSAGTNNGTNSGNVTFAPGRVGQGFVMNGNGNVVQLGNPTNLQSQDFSIETWIKRANTSLTSLNGNGNGVIFGYDNGGYGLYLSPSGEPTLTKTVFSAVGAGVTITDTNFHHVAVTKSGSTVVFYVDGVAHPAGPYDPGFTFSAQASIGGLGNNYTFLGTIDEVSFYNRALSASEVQAIYNADGTGKCTTSSPNCVPAPSGLVSWWRAQNDSTDTISGNNGALSGGVSFAPGEVGQGFNFNGTGEVAVPSSPSLNVQSVTLEAWVNPSVLDGNVETILNKENPTVTSPSDTAYELGIRGLADPGNGSIPVGHLAFYLGGIAGLPSEYGGWVDGGGSVPTNQWTHCALAFDGTSVRIYINGSLTRAISGLSGTINSTTGPFKIGSRSIVEVTSNPAVRFNGSIDEVSIYNRGLSTGEIQSIFNASTAGKCPPSSPPCVSPPSGLVSWWKAEGNTADQAGTNNGTLAGNTTYGTGRVGQAFIFDGSGDGVGVGNPTNLQLQTFTIEAWVKRSSASRASLDPYQSGVIFEGPWGGYGFGLWDDGRPFLTKVGYDNTSPTFAITDTNSFHHVAVTKSGSAVTFYLDGVAQVVGPYNSTFEFGGPAAIGARGGDYAASFLGSIDEVSVYNRALSAGEIQGIFGAGTSGKCSPQVPTNCSPAASGLVSLWPGEDNPNDVVDGNSGVAYGGVTYTNGVVGQAFKFDGSSGHIRIADRPNLRFTNGLTLEAWINPVLGIGRHQAVIGKWDNVLAAGTQKTFSFSVETLGRLYLYVSGNGEDSITGFALSSNSLPAGQWSHVAGTYDGSSVRVYINGVLQGQVAYNQGIFPGTNDMAIGGVVGGSPLGVVTTPFVGAIDEPAVYNRGLSSAEILAIYNAGSAGKCPTGIRPSILTQPQSLTLNAGTNANFSVTATGTAPLAYQWTFNGTNLASATTSSLSISNVQALQAGNYAVKVTNAFGAILSSNAVLIVNNISSNCAPPGIISWWPGEGNPNDIVDGNSGVAYGGVTYTNGVVGQAFKFDGASSGHIRIADRPNLRFTNGLTLEAWINPVLGIGTHQAVICKWDNVFAAGTQKTFSFSVETLGRLYLYVSGNGEDSITGFALSSNSLPAGQWSHVAGTYDGSKVSVYINGALQGEAAYNQGIFPGTNDMAIGGVVGGSPPGTATTPFFGAIDEPAVYNRGLSASEILAIFNAGSAGKCRGAITSTPPFIVSQPVNQTVIAGANPTFNVVAGGSQPLSYQWRFNGTNISAATRSSFTVTNAQPANAGLYSVLVSNSVSSLLSSNALLTVNPGPSLLRVGDASAASGATVTVPVLLTASGNENALQFSLNFSPSRLSYVSAILASGAGATLLVNESGSTTGRLGLVIGLPAGSTFPPGTQELAEITFTTSILTNAATTSISFVDQPLVRQVSDKSGNVLTATYTSGTVSIAAAMFEADLSPRPNGDKNVTVTDWVLIGRFAAHLESPINASEFQRADCAPRANLGNGQITITDWVQAGRYAAGLDPLTPVGGPTSPSANNVATTSRKSKNLKPSSTRQLRAMDTTLDQGHNGKVSIQLQAQGNENALGFSVTFDPATLTYTGSTLGSAAAGATLNVNTGDIASGRIGFALALPTGAHFAAGVGELVQLSFQAATSATGNVSVAFSDLPIEREISDSTANTLASDYLIGTIAINPLPVLNILQIGTDIKLSWPSWATDFVLQETTDVNTPGTWSNSTASVTSNKTESSSTLPKNGATKFYRLYKP